MADVKQTLNGFIDYASPKLCTVLARMWKDQQQAITYKEIREAIFAGQLDLKYLAQWQQDYSRFIVDAYSPLAQQAIDNSAKELANTFGLGARSLNYRYMDDFISSRGGRLIREVTEEQYRAINTLVRQASFSETMDVHQLARAIRPTIGLTQRQSQAAYNRYIQAIADGQTKEKARTIQAKYAEKLHRTRAETISITEMAFAYNHGQQAYMDQCIKDGLIGSAKKKWVTAFDERVCEICGKLDQETVDIDAPFSTGVLVPPGHPRCRCVVNYIDVTQPKQWVNTPADGNTIQTEMQDIPDENGLISDAQNDIINQENSLSGTTFQATHSALYGVDSEGYHHPITPEIQACQNYDDIAKLFVKNETSILDAGTFGKLPLDVQKEVAEGIRWAMNTYGLNVLPSKFTTDIRRKKTLGEYLDLTMEMRIRKSIEVGLAFPTTVHEMTHHADNVLGYPAEGIVDQAVKKLGLKKNSKVLINYKFEIAGSKMDDPHELLAGSMERYSIGKGNELAKEIAKLFLGSD